MAANKSTAVASDRQAVVADIARQLAEKLERKERSGGSFMDRIYSRISDSIADSGRGTSSLIAGVEAMQDNFTINISRAAGICTVNHNRCSDQGFLCLCIFHPDSEEVLPHNHTLTYQTNKK